MGQPYRRAPRPRRDPQQPGGRVCTVHGASRSSGRPGSRLVDARAFSFTSSSQSCRTPVMRVLIVPADSVAPGSRRRVSTKRHRSAISKTASSSLLRLRRSPLDQRQESEPQGPGNERQHPVQREARIGRMTPCLLPVALQDEVVDAEHAHRRGSNAPAVAGKLRMGCFHSESVPGCTRRGSMQRVRGSSG
jgi:hypothetical protein